MKAKPVNDTTIKSANVLTIATAKVLTIDEVNGVVRHALKRANGRHIRTYAYWYHNGAQKNADRHFHIAFTRDIKQFEKQEIVSCMEYHCQKNNWGRLKFLCQWGVGVELEKDGKREENTVPYLVRHKHCIGRNVRR